MKKSNRIKPWTKRVCVGGLIIGSAAGAFAQDAATMEKENQDLKARVDALELLAKKEGLIPSDSTPKFVSAMSDMTVSGFVQASYFINTQRPKSGYNPGYLWNTKDNSFSINKVKITFASPPAEHSDTDWSAGYRLSLMAGEDAPILNSSSGTTGFDYLREAYVELNVPIGTGLNVKAGELISLLNWESGDGGAANPNFSQGYQWYFTGNGPAAGVQLGYTFTDWLSLNVRVQNGLFAGPIDGNEGKAFIGSLNFKPMKNAWVNLIGWYESAANPAPPSTAVDSVISGISAIGGYQVTSKLGTGFEVDYFNFANSAGSSDLWSMGGWVWYDFTSKVGAAFRADYVDNRDGLADFGSPSVGGPAITSTTGEGYLSSLTLTLNLKPTPNTKIQPEIRYNHTSYRGGFDGKSDQFIVGCGATYLF